MKLAAGIIFYNDAKGLNRCLGSIVKCIDQIFCIDGKFDQFPAASVLSDDGSRDIVLSYPKTVLLDMPNATEIQKRQKYLELCKEHNIDYLLIIDSDEYVIQSDWDKFKINCQFIANRANRDSGVTDYYTAYHIFGIRMEYADGPNQFGQSWFTPATAVYPRLWYKPYEMEYRKVHYGFVPKDTRNPFSRQQTETWNTEIYGITLRHDPYYTRVNAERESASRIYKEHLMNDEGSI